MNLSLLSENYAVIKLRPKEPIPNWVSDFDNGLLSITYTADELSIVCNVDKIPEGLEAIEKTWRCLKVDGILDFSLTGILYLV